MLKTAVFLHGYNVNEKNWERVVWGVLPDKPGRIPVAIAVALEEGAEHLILFGSSIGKEKDGKWLSSGRWMTDLLCERFGELKQFTILQPLRELSLEQIRERIEGIFQLIEEPERPANTLGEL